MSDGSLPFLVSRLINSIKKADVSEDHLWYAIRGAINPNLIISNVAEALRITSSETEKLLIENGFSDLVAQSRLHQSLSNDNNSCQYKISSNDHIDTWFSNIFSVETTPKLSDPIFVDPVFLDNINLITDNIIRTSKSDPFLALYRANIIEYFNNFLANDAKAIDDYISVNFPSGFR